jgi:hypothetical protein
MASLGEMLNIRLEIREVRSGNLKPGLNKTTAYA